MHGSSSEVPGKSFQRAERVAKILASGLCPKLNPAHAGAAVAGDGPGRLEPAARMEAHDAPAAGVWAARAQPRAHAGPQAGAPSRLTEPRCMWKLLMMNLIMHSQQGTYADQDAVSGVVTPYKHAGSGSSSLRQLVDVCGRRLRTA